MQVGYLRQLIEGKPPQTQVAAGANHHVCKCSICTSWWKESTTSTNKVQWSGSCSIRASWSRMQQQYATTTNILPTRSGPARVHAAVVPDAINATCVRACRGYMCVLERMVWHNKDSPLRPRTLPLEGLWQKDNLIHQGCCRWVSATVSSRVYCEMINKIVGGHCMNTQWQEAQHIEVFWQSILGNVFWGSRTFQGKHVRSQVTVSPLRRAILSKPHGMKSSIDVTW